MPEVGGGAEPGGGSVTASPGGLGESGAGSDLAEWVHECECSSGESCDCGCSCDGSEGAIIVGMMGEWPHNHETVLGDDDVLTADKDKWLWPWPPGEGPLGPLGPGPGGGGEPAPPGPWGPLGPLDQPPWPWPPLGPPPTAPWWRKFLQPPNPPPRPPEKPPWWGGGGDDPDDSDGSTGGSEPEPSGSYPPKVYNDSEDCPPADGHCTIEVFCGEIPGLGWTEYIPGLEKTLHCWVEVTHCDGTFERFDKWQLDKTIEEIDEENAKWKRQGGAPQMTALAPPGADPEDSNIIMNVDLSARWLGRRGMKPIYSQSFECEWTCLTSDPPQCQRAIRR